MGSVWIVSFYFGAFHFGAISVWRAIVWRVFQFGARQFSAFSRVDSTGPTTCQATIAVQVKLGCIQIIATLIAMPSEPPCYR